MALPAVEVSQSPEEKYREYLASRPTPQRYTDQQRDMVRFMAGLCGDGNQVDAEAFVDQKSHGAAIARSGRRARRTGGRSRQGCLRGRPRSG